MIGLILNIILAVVLLIFSHQISFTSFIFSYLIIFGFIVLFSRVFRVQRYVRCSIGFIRFLALFSWEFIKSNLEVARLTLIVPKSKINPGFVDYSIEEMTFAEALLLSHCITLTPGTITAVFDWDKKILTIHVLNLTDPLEVQTTVDKKFKQAIWRFSR